MVVVPAGTGIGRRESVSYQSAVGRRPLRRSRAKNERLNDYMAKKGQPTQRRAAYERLGPGYTRPTKQERGRILRSTRSLPVFSQLF